MSRLDLLAKLLQVRGPLFRDKWAALAEIGNLSETLPIAKLLPNLRIIGIFLILPVIPASHTQQKTMGPVSEIPAQTVPDSLS